MEKEQIDEDPESLLIFIKFQSSSFVRLDFMRAQHILKMYLNAPTHLSLASLQFYLFGLARKFIFSYIYQDMFAHCKYIIRIQFQFIADPYDRCGRDSSLSKE